MSIPERTPSGAASLRWGLPAPWRCALAGILLGAAGYGLATRSGDRAGQVLGVAAVVLCAVSVAIPWSDLPGLFLET